MIRMKDRNSYKDIWLLGGAQLCVNFAQEDLVDEIILTVAPQSLRLGIPLGLTFECFDGGFDELFDLGPEKTLTDGMI